MPDLTLTLIQADLFWEDPVSNLAAFDAMINRLESGTDLIVLPEMFTTGFTMNAEAMAQDMRGSGVAWLADTSRKTGADMVGSLIIQEGGNFFNRLVWAKPDGTRWIYDKRHLFRMSGEHKVYRAGTAGITVELQGWKIRPFICYDLRFPLWTRNFQNSFDLALFIANWPRPRARHWRILLEARAIENQCYVVGVNRVGTDGRGQAYRGDSTIVDPTGRILFRKHDTPCTYTERLSYKRLEDYRRSFPAWMDADGPNFASQGP